MENKHNLVIQGLGESITEAVIGRWLKSVGDYVEVDEAVIDLETDKVNVDVTAPTAGVLKEQRFAEGDTVRVGDVVGLIEEGERPAGATSSAGAETAEATPEKTEDVTPAAAPAREAAAPTELPERDATGRVLTPAMRRAIREGDAPPPPRRLQTPPEHQRARPEKNRLFHRRSPRATARTSSRCLRCASELQNDLSKLSIRPRR